MAEIFWIRGNAAGRHETSKPHHVAMDVLEDKLTPFEKAFEDEPPDLDPQRFSHDDAWHVYARVNDEETNTNFPGEGYYRLVHLSPQDVRALFGF